MIAKTATLEAAAATHLVTSAVVTSLECRVKAELNNLGLTLAGIQTDADADAYSDAEMEIEDRIGYVEAVEAHRNAESALVEAGLAWIASESFRAAATKIPGGADLVEMGRRGDVIRESVDFRRRFVATLTNA
jgi:hypothetical protein